MYELLIQNGNTFYSPAVNGGVEWRTERRGSPGKLTFSVVNDGIIKIAEGNAVRLVKDGIPLFYGFIFTLKWDKKQIIDVTALDQIRYLKNKDSYVYENLTASKVIEIIAADFNLNVGTLEPTSFLIPSRVESNAALMDIIYNALDLEITNTKKMYVLYDDFGKLTLKSIGNMIVNCLIDEETGQNFDYSSSINNVTYNKIKVAFDNEETGKRDVYIAQHGENINRWGILQLYETMQGGENGQEKADMLLSLYNIKTRKLNISGVFGVAGVRAGCLVPVMLNLGDVKIEHLMLVEKCSHVFKESEHTMNLTLRGGEFI